LRCVEKRAQAWRDTPAPSSLAVRIDLSDESNDTGGIGLRGRVAILLFLLFREDILKALQCLCQRRSGVWIELATCDEGHLILDGTFYHPRHGVMCNISRSGANNDISYKARRLICDPHFLT
jgi:hypothetical protein